MIMTREPAITQVVQGIPESIASTVTNATVMTPQTTAGTQDTVAQNHIQAVAVIILLTAERPPRPTNLRSLHVALPFVFALSVMSDCGTA